MGYFEYKKIKQHIDETYQIVVETGTCLGYSTEQLKNHFNTVHTVEINKKLYQGAVEKFKNDSNVICHLGDSKEILKKLIPSLNGKVIFFLDAHWSGDNSVDWASSNWKGYGVETSYDGEKPTRENQVPLLREIEIIVNNFKGECVIYVDDADKFDKDGKGMKNKGFSGEDWSHLSLTAIRKVIVERQILFRLDDNQLVIKLSPIIKEK